jgi:histidine triad (HIT) family protein
MKLDCIFCQIIAGKAPAKIVYSDHQVTAFTNLNPIAPVHLLVVPNIHLQSVNDTMRENEAVLGHLITVARQLAVESGVDQSGYRLVINTGPDGGQSVFHLHLHLIGGRRLPFLFE